MYAIRFFCLVLACGFLPYAFCTAQDIPQDESTPPLSILAGLETHSRASLKMPSNYGVTPLRLNATTPMVASSWLWDGHASNGFGEPVGDAACCVSTGTTPIAPATPQPHYADNAITPITPQPPLRHFAHYATTPITPLRHYAITPTTPLHHYAITPITPLRHNAHYAITPTTTPFPGRLNAFLTPSDTFNKKRFWTLAGGGALAYAGASIGLYHIWYKDYPLGKFRFFDDWGEWERMDKAGHLFAAYAESYIAYKGARWTGIRQRPAAWIGAGVGTLIQSTIEVMDGFSENWGFSWTDFGFNTAGVGLFLGQELLWEDQRIMIKVSHTRPQYGDELIRSSRGGATRTVDELATMLYGRFPASFIKDYNGMTIWASVNPASFLKLSEQSRFPRWLSIAAGYGAQNVYGAYGNAITDREGNVFPLTQYPRYRQFYLSFDADLRRIRTQSPVLKTVFTVLSWIKIPAPTLEWTSLGERKFYLLYW